MLNAVSTNLYSCTDGMSVLSHFLWKINHRLDGQFFYRFLVFIMQEKFLYLAIYVANTSMKFFFFFLIWGSMALKTAHVTRDSRTGSRYSRTARDDDASS